jgi:beta-lactamase superfamily II metal-dependent hydrolase
MMPVGWVADSGQPYGGHAYNDALSAARLRGVPVVVPACHQRWVDDEVTFTFLSPCGPLFTDGANDVNENSLVVLVHYGTVRALFMGDAGFQSEERLLHQGVDLHADILKVASRLGLFFECCVYRRCPSSDRDRFGRPPQPLRPPSA